MPTKTTTRPEGRVIGRAVEPVKLLPLFRRKNSPKWPSRKPRKTSFVVEMHWDGVWVREHRTKEWRRFGFNELIDLAFPGLQRDNPLL